MIILPSIKTDSIDMILTDPPYNTTSLKLDKQSFDLSLYMAEFKRILKPNGWLFCFGSLEIGALLLNHFRFKFQYIWEKQAGSPAHGGAKMPMHQHENLWVFIQPDLKVMGNLYMDKLTLRTTGIPYTKIRNAHVTEFRKSQSHDSASTTMNTGYREGTTILKYHNKVHFPIREDHVQHIPHRSL